MIDAILEEDSQPRGLSPLPSLSNNNNNKRRGTISSTNSIGSIASSKASNSHSNISMGSSPISYGNLKPLSYGREKQHQIQLKQERKTLISNYKYSQFSSQPNQKPLDIE